MLGWNDEERYNYYSLAYQGYVKVDRDAKDSIFWLKKEQ